jgi:hypothetical protein
VRALVIVSSVVNVFDETMKSVPLDRDHVLLQRSQVSSMLGDESECHVPIAVVLERLVSHDRPEIGATDPNVHDVANAVFQCDPSTRRCARALRNQPFF